MIPRLPPLVRTTTFRLTALAAALFAFGAGVTLAYVYGVTATTLTRQTDRGLAAEIATFETAYARSGLNGVNREVARRAITGRSDYFQLLVYANGKRVSGDLDALPDAARGVQAGAFGFVYAATSASGEVARRRARGRVVSFPGGYRLLVGVDVDDDARVLQRIANTAWTSIGLVLALGVGAGALVSRRFAARLDALNDVARDVMAGDLERRAPRNDTGDELDELSANLNAMLDRIERLMTAMRHAGDSIAHDLRSPLTRLRARLESAQRSVDGEAGETLGEAVDDADQLLSTFDAVLRIARLEAGERRDAIERFDPAPLVADLAELYEPACEDAGLDFSSEIEPGLTILGDRALIAQALSNLLDNAVKYTPQGGAIALRLRRARSGEAEVSVTDTGPGVKPEDRDRVRQRFVRLDESRSAPGAGLGLTLVQAVADMHHARFLLDDGPGSPDRRSPGLRAALLFPAP